MNIWLMKTEPSEYSFDNLLRDGNVVWDGIRNYQARNYLKKMKKGDLVLIYHSGSEKQIVGIGKVVKEHYPDPKDKTNTWVIVDIAPVKKLTKPFTLKQIKKEKALSKMPLLRQSRLSVMPVTKEEYEFIVSF